MWRTHRTPSSIREFESPHRVLLHTYIHTYIHTNLYYSKGESAFDESTLPREKGGFCKREKRKLTIIAMSNEESMPLSWSSGLGFGVWFGGGDNSDGGEGGGGKGGRGGSGGGDGGDGGSRQILPDCAALGGTHAKLLLEIPLRRSTFQHSFMSSGGWSDCSSKFSSPWISLLVPNSRPRTRERERERENKRKRGETTRLGRSFLSLFFSNTKPHHYSSSNKAFRRVNRHTLSSRPMPLLQEPRRGEFVQQWEKEEKTNTWAWYCFHSAAEYVYESTTHRSVSSVKVWNMEYGRLVSALLCSHLVSSGGKTYSK